MRETILLFAAIMLLWALPTLALDCSPWPSAFEPPTARQTPPTVTTTVPAAPSNIPGRRYLPLTQEQVQRGVISCYVDDIPTAATVKLGFADFGPALNPPLTNQPVVYSMPPVGAPAGGFYSSCIGGQCSPSYSYQSAGCSTGTCTSGGCASCGR